MLLLRLSTKSLLNRKLTTALTLFSIAVSITLLLGVERIRIGAKEGFQGTISGVDLIVGARGGTIPLLLFSVFGIGNPEQSMSWQSYQILSRHPEVSEAVPISLGDSHRGFRVIATTPRYFRFYRFANEERISFKNGNSFQSIQDAVIGSEVARKLQYQLQKEIFLSHGTGEISFQTHEHYAFRIVGILNSTGTPIDRNIFIPIQAMDLLHKKENSAQRERQEISAAYLRLRSKTSVLQLQREINNYSKEPLTVIVPGKTLQELWQVVSVLEQAFRATSFLTFVLSLSGIILVFLTTLNERKREMAIFRSVGARPWFIASLLFYESGLIAFAGCILSLVVVTGGFLLVGPLISSKLGLQLPLTEFQKSDVTFLLFVFIGALMAAIIPALSVYRSSISEGLTVRL
jgi:putative ABC transport system permease protein